MSTCALCNNKVACLYQYCNKQNCYEYWLSNPIDNILWTALRSKHIFNLYIKINKEACKCTKRVKFLFDNLPNTYSIDKLSNALNNIVFDDTLQNMDEHELYNHYSENYKYLKYMFHTRYNMKAIEYKYNKELLIRYDILYDPITENKFSGEKIMYLFHGSPIYNWSSILRNGLKCTNKEMLLNGSVYGNGIYLSKNLSTSYGYAGNNCIIAICELPASCKQYIKNSGYCHVIPDENLVLIRSLVQVSNTAKLNDLQDILLELYNKNHDNHKIIKSLMNSKCGKRLIKEINSLKDIGYSVQSYNDDIYIIYHKDTNKSFNVYINNYPLSAPIIYLNNKVDNTVDDNTVNIAGVYLYDEFLSWKATTKLNIIISRMLDILTHCTDELYNCNITDIKLSVKDCISL